MLNVRQFILQLHATHPIHLVILISAQCNASSLSLFSNHISLRCSIQLHTYVISLPSKQQGNIFSSEKGGQWPEHESAIANPGSHSSISISINRQHVPKTAELITISTLEPLPISKLDFISLSVGHKHTHCIHKIYLLCTYCPLHHHFSYAHIVHN